MLNNFDDSYGDFLFSLLTSKRLLNSASSMLSSHVDLSPDIKYEFEDTVKDLNDMMNCLLQSMFKSNKTISDKISDVDYKNMVQKAKSFDEKTISIEAKIAEFKNKDLSNYNNKPKKEMLN